MIYFNTKYFAKNFIWLKKIDSTNTYIKKNNTILKDKTVVATLNQTNGRGTKNRKFYSIPGKTLAISILIKNIKTDILHIMPIFCSSVLLKTIKNFNIEKATIKWFNDILINNKKVAGILCESEIKGITCNIILGVGINITATKEEFSKLNLLKAGSIFSETQKFIKPEFFLQKFIETFEIYYSRYIKKFNPENIISYYKENCYIIGKYIKILDIKTNYTFTAKAINITNTGNIIVNFKNKKIKIGNDNFSILNLL